VKFFGSTLLGKISGENPKNILDINLISSDYNI
jgi:hypothetical protein